MEWFCHAPHCLLELETQLVDRLQDAARPTQASFHAFGDGFFSKKSCEFGCSAMTSRKILGLLAHEYFRSHRVQFASSL